MLQKNGARSPATVSFPQRPPWFSAATPASRNSSVRARQPVGLGPANLEIRTCSVRRLSYPRCLMSLCESVFSVLGRAAGLVAIPACVALGGGVLPATACAQTLPGQVDTTFNPACWTTRILTRTPAFAFKGRRQRRPSPSAKCPWKIISPRLRWRSSRSLTTRTALSAATSSS